MLAAAREIVARDRVKPPPTFAEAVSWLAHCDALPPDVDAKARLLLLDTFGCILAGLRHPDVQQFGQALQFAFPGDVVYPGSHIQLGPAGSAVLGAAAACWDEACEGHASAHGRPGLPVVPSLLALSSTRNASLADVLIALVTGYEIGARAGQAWRIPAGLHVDGGWHSLAVAAAVARLMSGPGKIQAAIETAACQIPASLYLPVAAASVVRNTYAPHAALLGMLSAAAAEAGFDTPSGALEEGRRRVLQATQPAQVAPSGEWTIRDGYLKPFAGVRHTHYGVEAALRLRRHPGFSLENVRAISLKTYGEAARYCGNRAPRTAIQAQFSLSYAIAAALLLGDLGPDAYADMSEASAIMQLEKLIVVEVDATRMRRGADLTIDVGETSFSETVDIVAGDPEQPMSRDDVKQKFARYTDPVLGSSRAAALISFFLEGDSRQPVRGCLAIAD
jgi:2-methylcitrate dehydratase PrpD